MSHNPFYVVLPNWCPVIATQSSILGSFFHYNEVFSNVTFNTTNICSIYDLVLFMYDLVVYDIVWFICTLAWQVLSSHGKYVVCYVSMYEVLVDF